LVDVLLDRPSMSQLSQSQIHAEPEDYTDSWTKHGQSLYGLHKAYGVLHLEAATFEHRKSDLHIYPNFLFLLLKHSI
jgi:hypothetical protein